MFGLGRHFIYVCLCAPVIKRNNAIATFLFMVKYFYFLCYFVDKRNAPGVPASALELAIWSKDGAGQAEKVPLNLNRIMPA